MHPGGSEARGRRLPAGLRLYGSLDRGGGESLPRPVLCFNLTELFQARKQDQVQAYLLELDQLQSHRASSSSDTTSTVPIVTLVAPLQSHRAFSSSEIRRSGF